MSFLYKKNFIYCLITGNRLAIPDKKQSQEHLLKVKFWSLNLIQNQQKLTKSSALTQD